MAGIQDLLQAVQIGQQRDQDLTQQAVQTTQQGQQLGQQQVEARAQADQAAIAAKQQELQGELKSQQASRAIADAWGANPDTQNFKLAVLGQTFWDNFQQVQQMDSQIAQKQSQGFLDNPIQWIANKLTVDSDIEARNAVATKANTAAAAMETINQNVISGAAAQKSIAETVTRDSIANNLRSMEMQSKLAQLDLQQKNLSYNMEGIKLLMGYNERDMDRQFKINSAQVQQQQLAISQGHLALAQAAAADEAKLRSAQLEKLDDEKAGWAQATAAYNAGNGTLGLPPISQQELKARYQLGGPAAKADFEKMYAIGLSKAASPSGLGVIAATPGEAAFVIAGKKAPLNSGMQDTKEFLMKSAYDGSAQANAAMAPGTAAKPDAVIKNTNEVVNTRTAVMSKDVAKDTPWGKNLYTAPDYKTMMSIPDVAASKFGQVVVGPQVAGGGSATNPEVLINAGLTAVQAGTLSYPEFVQGMTTYFNSAANWNNTTKNFGAVGIPLQKGYKTAVYNGTSMPFGRTNIVDLANRGEVENFLLRRRSNELGKIKGVESFYPVPGQ